MAQLKKRGNYYYGRWRKKVDGETYDIRKSLGIKYKKRALEALKTLDKLEQPGHINPYHDGSILKPF